IYNRRGMSDRVEMVVWVMAILLTGWILIPAIVHSLGFIRLRCDVHEDAARAEPPAGDPDFERRFRQFRELGFVPVGLTIDPGWFITSFKWWWRTLQGCRWLASPDRRTFVNFSRLIHEEPVRFSVLTIFDGDGIVRTTCPGAGLPTEFENSRRFELRNVDPAA